MNVCNKCTHFGFAFSFARANSFLSVAKKYVIGFSNNFRTITYATTASIILVLLLIFNEIFGTKIIKKFEIQIIEGK